MLIYPQVSSQIQSQKDHGVCCFASGSMIIIIKMLLIFKVENCNKGYVTWNSKYSVNLDNFHLRHSDCELLIWGPFHTDRQLFIMSSSFICSSVYAQYLCLLKTPVHIYLFHMLNRGILKCISQIRKINTIEQRTQKCFNQNSAWDAKIYLKQPVCFLKTDFNRPVGGLLFFYFAYMFLTL